MTTYEAPGNLFDLTGRVAVITGGAGFLGTKHAEAIASQRGNVVLVDLPSTHPAEKAKEFARATGVEALGVGLDITRPDEVRTLLDAVLKQFGRLDILINNAANNPKVEKPSEVEFSRFENFPLAQWDADVAVGLTGMFLCCQVLGSEMARRGKGSIVNVASFFSVVAPDQSVYRQDGVPEERQPVKPVSYSVVKHGVIGLTRYLATYWAKSGVRVNALSPGGVFNHQPKEFLDKVAPLTPMGRLAWPHEFQGAILYLCSDASSYVTGENLLVDGGRTCW